jgi:hypothetical protein
MGTITARSLILKAFNSWGEVSTKIIGIRSFELILEGERLLIPGSRFGDSQLAGSDTFDNATSISGEINFSEVDNTAFSRETGEPEHGYATAWYKWVAPNDGPVSFSTEGTIDTVLSVYTGDIISSLIPIVSNDDFSGEDIWSMVNFDAVAGQEYKICVAGKTITDVGLIKLQWAMIKAYTSIGTGSLEAFLSRYPKTGTLYYGWYQDNATNNDGELLNSDYVQLVIVFPFDITFDEFVINNFHHSGWFVGGGVKDIQISYSESEISQADAENHDSPIPGEVFILEDQVPMHVASDVVDEYFISVPNAPPSSEVVVGIDLFSNFSANTDIDNISIGGVLEIGGSFGTRKNGSALKCGLALAVSLTGKKETSPASLLSALEIGFIGRAERDSTSRIKAGMCLTCLMRAEKVPTCIMDTALDLGVKILAAEKGETIMNGTLYLGCKAKANSAPPPCLAQEFQHLRWF